MRWPNPNIVCTTALALVLAGCDVNIEATDLSAVTIENDRAVIEKALGKPDEVVEAQGFTVAAYTYEKKSYHVQVYRTDRSFFFQNPLIRRSEALKRRPPKGRLAAVYDADEKLVFAGSLSKANTTSEKLTSILNQYKASQTGDADALFSLSKTALIPPQRTMLEASAKKGSAEAAYELGKVYSFNREREQIDLESLTWLRKAAERGHVQAQTELGNVLLYGRSVPVDRAEAKVWLSKAATADHEGAKYQLDLLTTLENLLVRAERGEAAAQYELGIVYADGAGVKKEAAEAAKWWHKAAANGYPLAQVKLANIYLSGKGVLADFATAKEWAQKAEETDDPETLLQLAKTYRYSPGPQRKMHEAVKMFKRAAAMGERSAMYDLGTVYGNGEGVQRDVVQAYMWFVLAASKNDQAAANSRDRIAGEMGAAQIVQAERLARDWLKAHPQ